MTPTILTKKTAEINLTNLAFTFLPPYSQSIYVLSIQDVEGRKYVISQLNSPNLIHNYRYLALSTYAINYNEFSTCDQLKSR